MAATSKTAKIAQGTRLVTIPSSTNSGSISLRWRVVEYKTDRENERKTKHGHYQIQPSAYSKGVRRPLRGISIKPDSFAIITIMNSQAKISNAKLRNSSVENNDHSTFNFLINSVSETRTEKMQPVSTFGEDYVYFFGEQPKQMTFNATLINSENFRWEEEWWYNYERFFRGTRLAANNRLMRIKVDETVVYGYMTNCTTSKDSNNPHVIPMSFTVHVTEVFSFRAENKIGSHLVKDHQSADLNGYGNLDLNLHGESELAPISIGKDSLAIRDYNLRKYREISPAAETLGAVGIGGISRLLSDPSALIEGLKQDLTNRALAYMYGRTLVMPIDVAYANLSTGHPQLAEGTEAYDKIVSAVANKKSAVTLGKAPKPYYFPTNSNSYTNNYDEYVARSANVTIESKGDTREKDRKSRTTEVIRVLNKKFGIDKKLLTADENGIFNSAEGVNRWGTSRSDLNATMRFIGRAAFAAKQISLATRSAELRKQAADAGLKYRFPEEYGSIADGSPYLEESAPQNLGAWSKEGSSYGDASALVTFNPGEGEPSETVDATYGDGGSLSIITYGDEE